MMNVFDAARYILEETGPITTMKLQKLLYYAQAWSLVWDENELFREDFEAWAGGPVCRPLFDWHQAYYKVAAQDVPAHLLSGEEFSQEQIETMDAIVRDYGHHTGAQLSELAHTEAPWIEARNGLPPGASSSELISKAQMAWYYSEEL